MNTKRAMGMVLMLVAMLACQSAQAFYHPHTGRWLSRDPIGEEGWRNLYSCARNDLVGLVDPLGLYTPIGYSVTFGTKNSGGLIGGHRLGGTLPIPRINKLKTSIRNCKCCLDALDLSLELKVYVMAVGDKYVFGSPGWEGIVDDAIQRHTLDHEQVHVNVAWRGYGKLFPKIEGDCCGRCFSKPWFSRWTDTRCAAKWVAFIETQIKWAMTRVYKLGKSWDGHDRDIILRGPISDPIPYYKEVEAQLTELSQHKFCTPSILTSFWNWDPQ